MLNSNLPDETGVYGSILHYALIIAFVGGALLTFIYLWYKGRLDMDEEAKYQMLENDEKVKKNDDGNAKKRK